MYVWGHYLVAAKSSLSLNANSITSICLEEKQPFLRATHIKRHLNMIPNVIGAIITVHVSHDQTRTKSNFLTMHTIAMFF